MLHQRIDWRMSLRALTSGRRRRYEKLLGFGFENGLKGCLLLRGRFEIQSGKSQGGVGSIGRFGSSGVPSGYWGSRMIVGDGGAAGGGMTSLP